MSTSKKKPTRPTLRKIPLPAGFRALPKNLVYLGQGRDELKKAKASPFKGWCSNGPTDTWDEQSGRVSGDLAWAHYAAPADSAIAREILGQPAKAARKRTKTKKPSAVRKSAPADSVPTNSMKPIREWLEQLPDGYRERALRMAEAQSCLHHEADSLPVAINAAGLWEDSPEGMLFWRLVYRHYMAVEQGGGTLDPLPSLPEDDTLPTGVVAPSPSADPKGHAGALKPQLALIPPAASEEMAKALACGAERYGPWNWRGTSVEAMTYLHAMRRHIDRYLDGEDIDPDSGVHHLGHVMAGCGIVLDARKHGTLIDNRPPIPQQ